MKRTIILILILLFFAPVWNKVSAQEDSAQTVYVNYAINAIEKVDYIAQTFEIDFYFQMRWKANIKELEKQFEAEGLTLEEGSVVPIEFIGWLPENDFVNAQIIEARREPQYIFTDGYLLFDMRYRGTFQNSMNLRKFPFDDQELKIQLEDFAKTNDELVFSYGSESSSYRREGNAYIIESGEAFDSTLNFMEFELEPEAKSVFEEHKYIFNKEVEVYNRLEFILHIKRKTYYYYSKIISVACLIAIMSWAVFFMSPEAFGERSAYSITVFLALVGHNFLISNLLPLIPYLTIMDYFTIGANLMVFATLLENLVVFQIQKRKPILALRIDKICRIMFPILLLLLFSFFTFKSIY